MSTDVYFDFHSPQSAELIRAYHAADGTNGRNWPLFEKWSAFLKETRGQTKEAPHHYDPATYHLHYDPCRVGYLSNFVANCNYDLWRAFCSKWYWAVVTEENIPTILAEWDVIYTNSQKPENAEDCCMVDDISTTKDVEEDLRAHLGFYFETRVD